MAGVPHPNPISGASFSAVELMPDDSEVVMLEQRKLPEHEEYVRIQNVEQMTRAIRDMVVRGAPAIGIAAAYGMVLAARNASDFRGDVAIAAELLVAARPTAVNLAWAVRRMLEHAEVVAARAPSERVAELAALARSIHSADVAANRRMGEIGAQRVPDGATILTHCNAGALATGGYGTALGVVRAATEAGKRVRVLADETRPYLQGARLTAWELARDGIDVRVITDNSAAYFFAEGSVDLVVVGSDRIAKNGDVANKIGTYGVACLAHMHERPFYVAAPWSTVDLDCPNGEGIVIEQRPAREVTHVGGVRIVPEGVDVANPSFDVTPARLVSAIFTERGAVEPVGSAALEKLSGG